jgi:alanyl-tRNA synthetase
MLKTIMGNINLSIREKFLNFFKEKNHYFVEDKGIIPEQYDASALFINSGVHAIKPYIIGLSQPPARRLTSCQRCIRTIDIDRVGKNNRTLTYFHMLGSWSIGDYWKKETLENAYSLLTSQFNLDPKTFAITVFNGNNEIPKDEESAKIWKSLGISSSNIYFRPAEDNLWSMGNIGPLGPCTEVYIDRGKEQGISAIPGDESPRFLEIWNAGVFMTYFKTKEGSIIPLEPKVVDTGAGLERLATILENKKSVYETFPLNKIIEYAKANSKNQPNDNVYIVLGDHIRTSVALINAGVLPSNKSQGYVLRRLLRRAIYNSAHLGLDFDNFSVNSLGILSLEHEIQKPECVKEVIRKEYLCFSKTLQKGKKVLEKIMSDSMPISGEHAFHLFDTFGFPIELTLGIASERGISVDIKGYNQSLEKHRKISKKGAETRFK